MQPLLHNPYSTPPDFKALALSSPSFAKYVRTTSKGLPTIDFHDEGALRALTTALLDRDFQLKMSLPADRLCPIVPGRLEYVHYILTLVLSTTPTPSAPITGLDIGTGSSAIYPLLALRTPLPPPTPSLTMLATELDPYSISFARINVQKNGLEERVRLIKVEESGAKEKVFVDGIWEGSDRIDFAMCNPPFYSNELEVEQRYKAKELGPFAICTGGALEMITPGGEVSFVGKMIEESLTVGDRIRWFSTLLGKSSSLIELVTLLRSHSIENYTIHELNSGQTKRWLLIWSLQPYRVPSHLNPTASLHPHLMKLLPPSNAHSYFAKPNLPLHLVREKVLSSLTELDGVVVEEGENAVTFRTTKGNTWSRAARRRGVGGGGMGVVEEGEQLIGEVRFEMIEVEGQGGQCKVLAEWGVGKDGKRKDWDGLWGFLVRRVGEMKEGGMEMD